MKYRNIFASTLIAAGVSFSTPGVAQTKWDMPNEYSATSIHGEGDVYFAGKLKELSGGKIEIVHHFGGALGYKSKDQLDAVGDGAVPIANTFVAPLGGVENLFLLSSLPFVAVTHAEARQLYETAKPYYEKIFAKYNQKLLYSSPWPPSGLWGKKPLDSMDALKAVKLRTYDVPGTQTFRAAGAAPVQLSWADVVPQLGTGGIDAVLTSAEAGLSSRFNEHLSHFTEINYASPLNMVTINLDTWNALSPELQQAVTKAAAAADEHTWAAMAARVDQNYQEAAKRGVQVVTEAPAGYRAALSKFGAAALADWKSSMGSDGEAIVSKYRTRVGRAE
ncbi:TRAP transporter substrate-binding protein [Denitromonas iodatirespirans]|uniref:TRAP transporter substrate-binding protein n=1 Tax=Denitromonas iodatirespirans TaxID=2795389 RepID=A0A944DD34_DENI1|nr:TRAP transporter substrate-binding protein [Denitromonas iodatirespirans]MBT0963252.1 TRAP transporter substrate-binding protein [Denitromonas iodatirespirans]